MIPSTNHPSTISMGNLISEQVIEEESNSDVTPVSLATKKQVNEI